MACRQLSAECPKSMTLASSHNHIVDFILLLDYDNKSKKGQATAPLVREIRCE